VDMDGLAFYSEWAVIWTRNDDELESSIPLVAVQNRGVSAESQQTIMLCVPVDFYLFSESVRPSRFRMKISGAVQ